MPTSDPFLIYGATGFTGRLLARAAKQCGLRPVLCARDEPRLAAIAAGFAFEYRVAQLDASLDAVLDDIEVVLHAAGPFSGTFRPMVGACLRTGTHYLDLSGEVATIEAVWQHDAQARRRSVMLMPGVGFDVVASDCLAAHVWRRLRGARHLAIGISGLDLVSRGSAKSTADKLGCPSAIRRDGTLIDIPQGSLRRAFDYGEGMRQSVAVGFADLASAYFTTGIPNIEVFCEETTPLRMLLAANRYLGASPWARRWIDWQVQALPDGPTDDQRARSRAVVVAEVQDGARRSFRARLRTRQAYDFTCATALSIAGRVLRGDVETGFQTPARVYGSDFVLSLAGVLREDIDGP